MEYKEFERLVEEALVGIPQKFKELLENVDVTIEDEPDMELARKMGLGTRGRLLGLYQGVPLSKRTHYYGLVMPDKITIFKKNIERVCNSDAQVREEVRHVIQHEIAHHFGISDKRLKDTGTY